MDFAAFPTQKYRYMPSSSPLVFLLGLCVHAQATRIFKAHEQYAGSIAGSSVVPPLLHSSMSRSNSTYREP